MSGSVMLNGFSHYFVFPTEELKQDTAGFEVGLRKKIVGRVWAKAYYNYTPLGENKVDASSMQWVGLSLQYTFRRR